MLEQLVINFKNAIEEAFNNDDFLKITPFNRFPNECCDLTCDLLGQYLLEYGIQTYQINGVNKYDSSWRHVWLVTLKEGLVIDITEKQFIGKIITQNEIRPHLVGEEGVVHKIFCKQREKEDNTRFVDVRDYTGFNNTPNSRQKVLIEVYNIVKQYL